jgi:hypothetical protein
LGVGGTPETTDLVLRMGRQLFANPGWTPALRRRAPLRSLAAIAPDHAGFVAAISTVHHVCDAVACVASAGLDLVMAAHKADGLYISNDIMEDERYRSGSYVSAPHDRVYFLQQTYEVAIKASLDAVNALDDLAIRTSAPSKILALRRAAVATVENTSAAAQDVDVDTIARRTRHFTRPKRARTMRRADIDPSAIVRAYEQDLLSVQRIATQHMASTETISAILRDHGIRPLPPWAREGYVHPAIGVHAPMPTSPAPDNPAQPAGGGPVETAIAAAGSRDPWQLRRAAVIDKAAAALIAEATEKATGNAAAQLAATNFPHPPPALPGGRPGTTTTHPAQRVTRAASTKAGRKPS